MKSDLFSHYVATGVWLLLNIWLKSQSKDIFVQINGTNIWTLYSSSGMSIITYRIKEIWVILLRSPTAFNLTQTLKD